MPRDVNIKIKNTKIPLPLVLVEGGREDDKTLQIIIILHNESVHKMQWQNLGSSTQVIL